MVYFFFKATALLLGNNLKHFTFIGHGVGSSHWRCSFQHIFSILNRLNLFL